MTFANASTQVTLQMSSNTRLQVSRSYGSYSRTPESNHLFCLTRDTKPGPHQDDQPGTAEKPGLNKRYPTKCEEVVTLYREHKAKAI